MQSKSKPQSNGNDSDDDPDVDVSEKAPLMGSTLSLSQVIKKPEVIANIPKVTFDDLKSKSETALHVKEIEKDEPDRTVSSQPVKRRSEYMLYTYILRYLFAVERSIAG